MLITDRRRRYQHNTSGERTTITTAMLYIISLCFYIIVSVNAWIPDVQPDLKTSKFQDTHNNRSSYSCYYFVDIFLCHLLFVCCSFFCPLWHFCCCFIINEHIGPQRVVANKTTTAYRAQFFAMHATN